MLDLVAGIKQQLERLDVRPVRLPWPYTGEDGVECAIELDVPRIGAKEWTAALDAAGVSLASLDERAKRGNEAGLLAAMTTMDEKNRTKAVEKALGSKASRSETLARVENLVDPFAPALLRADAEKLCANGTAPAPILSVIKTGRLVPITRKETVMTRVRALAGAAGVPLPLAEGEAEDLPTKEHPPVKLDADDIASLFRPRDKCLASPSGLNHPAELAHVAALRFVVTAAHDHAAYQRAVDEKKSIADGGEGGERPPSETKPRRSRKRSKAGSTK